MGNTNGGGGGSWRQETVESAYRASRPVSSSSGSNSGPGSHSGVVVKTKEGNSYLIHHPGPDKLATVTPASNMSNRWTKDHDITVKGTKSVQTAYNGAGGRTTNTQVNYATAGTCHGASSGVEKALEK